MQRADERVDDLVEQLLAGHDIAAADKNRCVVQIAGPARKNRTVNQWAHLGTLHGTILQQLGHPGIQRNDRIKHARMRVGIELDQDVWFAHRL